MENSGILQNVQLELKKVHKSLHMKRDLSKLTRVAAELSWNAWDIPLVVNNLYREFDRVMHKGNATKKRLTEIATALTQGLGVLNYKFPPREQVASNVYFYNQDAQFASSNKRRRQEATGSLEATEDEPNIRKKLLLLDCGLSPSEKAMLENLVALDWTSVTEEWREDVTHVVVSSSENHNCSRKRDVLLAILHGKWIVTSDWIRESLNQMKLVSEETYEVDRDLLGLFQGPRKGRLRIDQNMPGLFAGIEFTLSSHLSQDMKVLVEELVSTAGGEIMGATEQIIRVFPQRRYFVFDEYIPGVSSQNPTVVLDEKLREFLVLTDKVPHARLIGYTKIANAIASLDNHTLDSRGQKPY